jgi:hypothetical protein
MKRILVAALCVLAFGFTANAQDSLKVNPNKDKVRLYLGGGVAVTDYNFNKKLANSDLPTISKGVFELTVGFNVLNKHTVSDFEFCGDYFSNKTTAGEKVKTLGAGFTWRPHYIVYKKGGSFFSAGFDTTLMITSVDIYTRDNTIDLNDLNPETHTGHISLYNSSFYIGPSMSFGILSDKDDSFRITTGYGWNVARASWKSDYANVDNTVKENGQGRFYAKLIWLL